MLGGSFYYVFTSAAYFLSAILLWKRKQSSAYLTVLVFAMTLIWALWESGLNYWALFPHLLIPAAFSIISLILLPFYHYDAITYKKTYFTGGALVVFILFFFFSAFLPHETVKNSESTAVFVESQNDNIPSDRTAYGRNNTETRYAMFAKINRENIKNLNSTWVHRTGDPRDGIVQNTPLSIDYLVYSCTSNSLTTAIDSYLGQESRKFDSHSESPVWQCCRWLGYFKNNDVKPGSLYEMKFIHAAIDACIIALNAKTDQNWPEMSSL